MQLPEQTREATSKFYSFILDRLDKKFPELYFNQLLLPDCDTRINGKRLGEQIQEICTDSLFQYGKLESVFIFRYICEFTFTYHGVNHVVRIDYRKPKLYFTEDLLERFRIPHEHKYHKLYWEEGGGGMDSGTPYTYSLCRICLKKKSFWTDFLSVRKLIERFEPTN